MDHLYLAVSLLVAAGNLYFLVDPDYAKSKWQQGSMVIVIVMLLYNSMHFVVKIRLEKINKPVPAATIQT